MDIAGTSAAIDALINFATDRFMDPADRTWARNKLLSLAHCTGYVANAPRAADDACADIDNLLAEFARCAEANGVAFAGADERENFCCAAMDALMPRPGEAAYIFSTIYDEEGPEAACNFLYRLSCDGAYVHEAAAARNISWIAPSTWGDLEITINLAKPEKDPRAIAALANAPAAATDDQAPYPACQLCLENEGYAGRPATSSAGAHPARQNLRIARIALGNETWGLQYSPYSYYREHCIVINPEHVPMHIDRTTLGRLLDFVDAFPHYFIGSNADLPIVGGSILNHDHFQAGNHTFPLEKAANAMPVELGDFPAVEAHVVKWPLTTLRLASTDRAQLLDAATHVLDAWRDYTDAEVGIFAETDGVPHNTITPICRRTESTAGALYTFNLCLRCNITSAEHPLGVFHPHAHLHHIKRENIGLIEAMGLAILPGRLARELTAVEEKLLAHATLDDLLADETTAKHAEWALEIAKAHPDLSADNVSAIVRTEVGRAFEQVLECAGVFKWDEAGRAALERFLATLS